MSSTDGRRDGDNPNSRSNSPRPEDASSSGAADITPLVRSDQVGSSSREHSPRRGSTATGSSSSSDRLFEGLSRGLAESQQQQRPSGDSSDDDDEESKEPYPRVAVPASSSSSSIGPISPNAVAGNPGSLSAPLISPPSARVHASPSARRVQENILRRHIRVKDGEFEMSRAERSIVAGERSWFQRTFFSGEVKRTDLFRSNAIKSSRYEWYNFLPKNLYEQLMPHNKPANFYFLCIAVLQCIREISTTNGRPTILVPLLFVLTVTGIKDALEDSTRHKQDRVKNLSAYMVYRNGKWIRSLSKNLLVGDLVRIKEGQRIPADSLLVSSGGSNSAYVYVDTKELDGETNLKPKQVPPACLSAFDNQWRDPSKLDLDLKADVPSQVMSQWNGDLTVNGKRENVNLGNFLLSDSILRNTSWAVSLIVYTGEDSKIRMNMARQLLDTRQKVSSVFQLTKKLFIFMVCIQIATCIIAAIDAGFSQAFDLNHSVWYLIPDQTPWFFAFLRLFTWFIIVKDFIPISLYVSLELVQFWQAIFISWDKKMTATIDGVEYPTSAQTSKLNEELSQISYIFSDKTGTLTRNAMVFRKCIIGTELYGTGTTEAGRLRQSKLASSDRKQSHRRDEASSSSSAADEAKFYVHDDDDEDHEDDDASAAAPAPMDPNDLRITHVEFNQVERVAEALDAAPSVSQRLLQMNPSNVSQPELVQLFLYALSLNNSVFPKVQRSDARELQDELDEEEEAARGFYSHRASRLDIAALEAAEEARHAARHENLRGNEPVFLECSSPDERALVAFAQALGFELIKRAGGQVDLRLKKVDAKQLLAESRELQARKANKQHDNEDDEPDEVVHPLLSEGSFRIEHFEEVALLDFTAKRKRMTVVLRPIIDGKPADRVLVFIKGADSALKPLLQNQTEPQTWEAVFGKLGEFGNESLRTLLLGWSIQPLSWWEEFREPYAEVQRNQMDAEKGHVEGNCSKDCQICDIENKIEMAAQFSLLGATAIEDCLQQAVPHTLAQLSKAGIKIWMLTGDNLQTGTNIAISCNLLDADMSNKGRLFEFDRNLDTPELVEAHINRCQRRIQQLYTEFQGRASSDVPLPVFGLSFHGDVWKLLVEEHQHFRSMSTINPAALNGATESLLDKFFSVASQCKAVIACRLEPKEKADIVRLMKKRTGKVVLAIGDGNNDCPMIKQADVGVGLRGVEGTSAVAISDYAISQFKFLQRLLLVHGRLNYRRISLMINYVFYKSSILVWTLFLFGIFSQFSGTFYLLDWATQLHNVAYTALPILVFAVFDWDLSQRTLEANPHIYSLTRGPVLFNFNIFLQWMLSAFLQACLCFFIPFWALGGMTSPAPNMQGMGLWSEGMAVYVCVVFTTNMRLIWEFQSWTVYHHISLWGSLVIFLAAMCMFSSSPKFAIGGADYYFVAYRLAELARFWFVVIVTVGACMMLDLVHHHIVVNLFTNPIHLLMEAERRGGPKQVAALARALHRQQQKQEQEELLFAHAKDIRGAASSNNRRGSNAGNTSNGSGAGSTHWEEGASEQAQRNALLNRRGRGRKDSTAAAADNKRSSQQQEAADDVNALSPESRVFQQTGTYTGGDLFSFTPRSTYVEHETAHPTTSASSSTAPRSHREE